MKKLFIIFAAFVTFLFASCDLGSKKIVVKADPSYKFSIGSIKAPLEIDLVKTIKEGIGDQIECYDYNPGGKCWEQKLLLKQDIYSMDLDIASYFSEDSLASGLQTEKINQEITVPSVNFSEEIEIAVDVLNEKISDMMQIPVAVPIILNPVDISSDALPGAVTGGFSTITYKTGFFVIKFSDTLTKQPSQVLNGESVQLICNGAVISEAVVSGDTVKFDMTGKSIDSTKTSLKFVSDNANSSVSFIGKMENAKISSVQGLTLDKTVINIGETIATADLFSKFNTCIIEDGCINIKLNTTSAWNGMKISYPISFTGAIEGSTKTETELNGSKYERLILDELNHGDIRVQSEIAISFDNGCINNLDDVPKLSINSDIKKIKEVSIVVEGLESQEIKYPVPAEVMTHLKSIDLGKSEFSIGYNNNLPEGNEIEIALKSNFLNINDSSKMKNGVGELIYNSNAKIIEFEKNNEIDLLASFKFKGSTSENPKLVTVKNIEPGKTYTINVTIKPSELLSKQLNWNRVEVSLADLGFSDVFDTNIDFRSMISDALKNSGLGISEIPNLSEVGVYLYVTQPNLVAFNSVSAKGNVKAYTSEENFIYLVKDSDRGIVFKRLPDLNIENEIVKGELLPYESSVHANIQDVLNNANENENLIVSYDLRFESDGGTSTVWIPRSDIYNADISTIEAVAFIELPLQLEFKNDTEINLMNLFIKDSDSMTDLLGRDQADAQGYEFLKHIESGAVNYTVNMFPIDGDIRFVVDLPENVKQKNNFKSGKIEVKNIDRVLSTYPLTPKVMLLIPRETDGMKNKLTLKRDLSIDLNLSLELNVDMDYVIYGGE